MCCIFGLNCCLQEIKVDKSGTDLWKKDSSSKKRAADSGKKNFELRDSTVFRKVPLWVITLYVEVILFQ